MNKNDYKIVRSCHKIDSLKRDDFYEDFTLTVKNWYKL